MSRDGFVSTTASALVTMEGSDTIAELENLQLSAVNGTAINVTGTPGSLFVRKVTVDADTLGTFSATQNLELEFYGSCDSGITFLDSGAPELALKAKLTQKAGGTGTLIDLGSIVWDFINIHESELLTQAGGTGLSGLATSGNLNTPGLGNVYSTRFDGGTALNNITTGDARWIFHSSCLGV